MFDAGGCPFAVDPERSADEISVVWSPKRDPRVVLLAPAPKNFDDRKTIDALVLNQQGITSEGRCVLVDHAGERLPLVLMTGMSERSPAAALIPLDPSFPARAEAALQLWRLLNGQSRRRRGDYLTRQRRQRLVLALRALDGRLAGHVYRSIAAGLFGDARVPKGPAWKTHDLRDRTIRLARTGTDLMCGGYLDLLRG
ncbi:hypothetical protein A33M_1178 [Rhodovulum sp. PH10]|nr:hypothetical protein A33M_1178 [Rhodovulum sp. PH10]